MCKKIYFFFFQLLMLFIISCGNSETIPAEVISKDSMINILADMHTLEATSALGHIDTPNKGIKPESFNSGILKKYNISKERFDSSYSFYTQKPELINLLYDDVIDELSERQALLNK